MQTSHSLKPGWLKRDVNRASDQLSGWNHDRIARAAVLNGVSIPPVTAAILASRGVDVGALETRIRENMGFRR